METLTRRDFIKALAAASIGAYGTAFPKLSAGSTQNNLLTNRSADRVILLWMAGGMPHTETFDPKHYSPFSTTLRSSELTSTFPTIPSSCDGIQLCAGMENIAQVMHSATLIRSYRGADLGFILHPRHQYLWHTGYVPPQTIAVPHIGAVLSRTLGSLETDLPAFVHIGQRLDDAAADELRSFLTAGFLGAEHGPFLIVDPKDAKKAVSAPQGMDFNRFDNRQHRFQQLLKKSPIAEVGSSFQKDSYLKSLDDAYRISRSPKAAAFDLEKETPEVIARYNTGRFGLGCLLARRLCEAGVRFIEVTTEWIPFANWDTHRNGNTGISAMKQFIDRPVSQLIRDLEERGMLNNTLVILASEFSRDAVVEGSVGKEVKRQAKVPEFVTEPRFYGLHNHFTGGGSIVVWGGGFKRGFLYGKTRDERPCEVVENEIRIEDFHATMYHALGIPPDLSYEVEGRPVYVTKDGKGKARRELLLNQSLS